MTIPLPDHDAVYGKTQKGKDLEKFMLLIDKLQKCKPSESRRLKRLTNEATCEAMDFIGKYGIHPVDLMKRCGFA